MNIEPLEKYLKGDNIVIFKRIMRLFPVGTIIAGGSARQIFLNEQFGSTDIDFYFPSRNAYNDQERRLYNQFRNSKHSGNATTVTIENIAVQLIKKVYSSSPQEIFDTYDFTCCMFAIKDDQIYYTDEAKEHALGKYIWIANPSENNVNRIGKYLRKGYLPLCSISQQVLIDFLAYAKDYPRWNNVEPDVAEILDGYFGTDIRY